MHGCLNILKVTDFMQLQYAYHDLACSVCVHKNLFLLAPMYHQIELISKKYRSLGRWPSLLCIFPSPR